MSGLLIGLAVLVALGAMGGRLARRRLRAHRASLELGRSAEHPLRVESFHEVDDFAEMARCACGGLLDKRGEGSRSTPQGELRIVRCECLTCEDQVDLFFEISALRH